MSATILDLVGDVGWESAAAQSLSSVYVPPTITATWVRCAASRAIVVDCRDHWEEGLVVLERLRSAEYGEQRLVVTERESAGDHRRAYEFGATRVVVMSLGEQAHARVLSIVDEQDGQAP